MVLVKAIFGAIFLFQVCQVTNAASVTNAPSQATPPPNKAPSSRTSSTKCDSVHFNNYYSAPDKDIKTQLNRIENQLADIQKKIDNLSGNNPKSVKKNCAELYKSGLRKNGVYTIDPDGLGSFDVFCDQKTAGGGWTVFQKRLDGSVDFNRGWNDYKRGFGNLNGEFWLGLDKINRLTKTKKSRLRVELEDTKGNTAYAEYDLFAVSSENTNYKISLGTYSGTAGDSLDHHRDSAFSTKDRDNDNSSGNCAVSFKGGWWFNSCVTGNLNGFYYHGHHSSDHDGIDWRSWKGRNYSAKRAEMMTRPVDF